MRIHVLCNDGSPLGITLRDLWGEGNRGIGVGGSEYALLTMCEIWHNMGHEVILFNNPLTPNGSPFEQRAIHEFDTNESRDVLITFRSPNPRSVVVDNCLKVWWSCDQYTIGSYSSFANVVDKIVCISPFHASFFQSAYGINNAIVIDLPVRIKDLEDAGQVKKVPQKVIFTSVPDRGLMYLRRFWDAIQDRCHDVNLTITSDYRLWGVESRNSRHLVQWSNVKNVRFLGAIPRKQLVIEQLEAQILAYPCIYDELFCISVAEAQCAGVFPITSGVGALTTTNLGRVIPGNPHASGEFPKPFIDAVIDYLCMPENEFKIMQSGVQAKAILRFNPERIANEWDRLVFGG